MKTNKSYSKRVKVTANGKLVVRKPGKNHFNAKESRSGQLNAKRSAILVLNPKAKGRFLPFSK